MRQELFNLRDADILLLFDKHRPGEVLRELMTEVNFRAQVFPKQAQVSFAVEQKLVKRVELLWLAIGVFDIMTEREFAIFRERLKRRCDFVQTEIDFGEEEG